ncbi:MAG: DUF6492 family protein [Parachlamydiaceae bacterium]|nr:DUF6492 family protein [Parachlamydiaceae bacterium]
MYKFICLLFCFFIPFSAQATKEGVKKNYPLTDSPIDVVIVSHPKDKPTIDDCIDGILENCNKVRRVIVVSSERLTNKAEWFNENEFPFNKDSIAKAVGKGDMKKAKKFFNNTSRGAGWYFQQLLKLYSPFIIPGISPNVLVVDADAIFMNPVSFLNEKHGGLFCMSPREGKEAYFQHAERLVPGYQRIFPEVYSVCHHMLFQMPILKDLFKTVERYHHKVFWKAFCHCVDLDGKKGASEYEIYYNFALRNTDQVNIRTLLWTNSGYPEDKIFYQAAGYHFVAFHTYMRGKWNRFIPKPIVNQ